MKGARHKNTVTKSNTWRDVWLTQLSGVCIVSHLALLFDCNAHRGSTGRQKYFLQTAYHQIWPPQTYVEVKCHFTAKIVIRMWNSS